MTTFNTILIKYSTVTLDPVNLLKGELAYSEASGKLFIGNDAGLAVHIGGADLVSRVGGLETLVGEVQDLVNSNHSSVTSAINAIKDRLDQLEAFRSTAEGELSTVDSRIDAAKTDVEGQIASAAATAQSNLADAVSALEGQIGTAAQGATDALAAATSAQGAINSSLSAQIATVAQDLSDFEGETAQALAGLQSQIDQTASGALAALAAKDLELEGDIDALDVRVDDIESMLNGGAPTFDSLTVTGDLVVQGQTVTVDSEVTTIKDPVITLGDGSLHADGLGRGVEYKYYDGGQKIGFFGVDTTDSKFKFIPDASANGNAFSGAAGVVVADLEGKFATARSIAIDGEVQGTAVQFDGSADVTLTVAVVAQESAVSDSVVRRTATGGVKAVDVEVSGDVVGGGSTAIRGCVINGGEF